MMELRSHTVNLRVVLWPPHPVCGMKGNKMGNFEVRGKVSRVEILINPTKAEMIEANL